ncbi:MAG: twin-arginine translocase TatA/TatE family subunit [Chloroflexota bacterium]
MLSGLSPVHLILILAIALIVVGPGKLPDVGASLGKTIKEFRKAASDVQEATNVTAAPAPAPAAAPVAAAPAPAPVQAAPAPIQAAPVAAPVAEAVAAPAAEAELVHPATADAPAPEPGA